MVAFFMGMRRSHKYLRTNKGGKTMTNRNDNRKQPHTGGSQAKGTDTEFGTELGLNKKQGKKAARESNK